MATKTSVSRRPTVPLVEITETALRSRLAQYRQWRATQPLTERFAELLWSPEGMSLEVPSPTIMVWDAKRKQSIERQVNANYWLQRQLNRQRQHGDGCIKKRASEQREAIDLCGKRYVGHWPRCGSGPTALHLTTPAG